MERLIDFARDRNMLCNSCRHQFLASLDWIDRWVQSDERCPGCGLTCEHEDAPRVSIDPRDFALDDDKVAKFNWYHTSTQPDWPATDYDPTIGLTADTRARMGGDERVAAWAERQRAKALHVGTYEAAVHNMLRRMRDQGDRASQFYLYRVHLKPSVTVREDWLIDPSNLVGDVVLEEVCPPGVDVARYLNYHEDPGGLSLALGRGAIAGVQRLVVPLPDACQADDWANEAVVALENASDVLVPASGKFGRFMRPSSQRASVARSLGAALAASLPINLRRLFESTVTFDEGDSPAQWACRTIGLFDLIANPSRALTELDQQGHRTV